MLGLSPVQLRQAADLGSPSARFTVDETIAQNTTTQSLQEQVSSKLQQLKNEKWSSKLPFHGISPFSAPRCIEHDDILTFCGHKMLKGQVFRFSSEVYPPTKEGLNQLAREIKLAAKLSGGADLVSKGCSKQHKQHLLRT
jgi:hypothetical protein